MEGSEKYDALLEKVHVIRCGVGDIFKAIVDAQTHGFPNKAQLLQDIRNSAKTVEDGIQFLKTASGVNELIVPSGNIQNDWSDVIFANSPNNQIGNEDREGINMEMLLSMETKLTQISEKMAQETQLCFPNKKPKIDHSLLNLNNILEEVAGNNPTLSIKKIYDPFHPDLVTSIAFVVKGVFQGEAYLATPLTSFAIERVAFCGLNEKDGQSKHCIFLAMSEQARAALVYYTSHYPGSEFQKLFKWISSFGNLFSAECIGCGKILQLDAAHTIDRPIFLPSSCRSYDTLLPYHPQCISK